MEIIVYFIDKDLFVFNNGDIFLKNSLLTSDAINNLCSSEVRDSGNCILQTFSVRYEFQNKAYNFKVSILFCIVN